MTGFVAWAILCLLGGGGGALAAIVVVQRARSRGAEEVADAE